MITDLQECMKASIMTHLRALSPAQVADFRGPRLDGPQGSRLVANQAPPEQEKTPAARESFQSLRQKPIQGASCSPLEKDMKHAAPKSYAEQGCTQRPPEEAGAASTKQTTVQNKQSLCQTA